MSEITIFNEVNHFEKAYGFYQRCRKGDVTADEVREHYTYLTTNEPQVTIGIFNYLKSSAEYKRKRNDTLTDLAKKEFTNYLTALVYTFSDSFSHILFSETIQQAIWRQIKDLTDEMISSYQEKRKQDREKRRKSIENPETLDELIYKKNRMKLSVDELALYDKLFMENMLEIEARNAQSAASKVSETLSEVNLTEPIKSQHSRTKEDIWIVRFKEKVEREVFDKVNTQMKRIGGHYSTFPSARGFIFKEDPTEALKGEFNAASDSSKKNMSLSEKLLDLADTMQAAIDEKFSDRLCNTDRRARMAASAENAGYRLKKIQGILRNLAKGFENDTIKYLKGLSAKTHVETLLDLVNRAHSNMANTMAKVKYPDTEENKNSSTQLRYSYQKELMSNPKTKEDIYYIKYPYPGINIYNLKDLLQGTDGVKGTKALRKTFEKKYNEAVKNNVTFIQCDKYNTEELLQLAGYFKGREIYISDKEEYKRLRAMGITKDEHLREALREFIDYIEGTSPSKEETTEREIKTLESETARMKIPGYFPTPKETVEKLLEWADISENDRLLEPSAGAGHIADEIKKNYPDNILHVVEYNASLRNILEKKGHNIVAQDFLEYKPTEKYDVIIMNPPFEKNSDIKHVLHAYENIKEGGKVIAIMSEHSFFANDAASKSFREFLEEKEGISQKLPEGTFLSSDRQTGVNTRIVVLRKKAVSQWDKQAAETKKLQELGISLTGVRLQDAVETAEIYTAYKEGKLSYENWTNYLLSLYKENRIKDKDLFFEKNPQIKDMVEPSLKETEKETHEELKAPAEAVDALENKQDAEKVPTNNDESSKNPTENITTNNTVVTSDGSEPLKTTSKTNKEIKDDQKEQYQIPYNWYSNMTPKEIKKEYRTIKGLLSSQENIDTSKDLEKIKNDMEKYLFNKAHPKQVSMF